MTPGLRVPRSRPKENARRAREGLYRQLILEASAAAAEAAAGPAEMLIAAVGAYVDFFVGHPDYLRIHLRGGHAWGLAGAGSRSHSQAHAWEEGIDLYAGIFERGVGAGVFHPGPPRLLARMMIAMQQVQLADWVERGMQQDPGDLVADVHAWVRRAFCR